MPVQFSFRLLMEARSIVTASGNALKSVSCIQAVDEMSLATPPSGEESNTSELRIFSCLPNAFPLQLGEP